MLLNELEDVESIMTPKPESRDRVTLGVLEQPIHGYTGCRLLSTACWRPINSLYWLLRVEYYKLRT